MEVFKNIKQIYTGKNALANHITLFALVGIMAILLNNVASCISGNFFFFDFFTTAPASKIEIIVDMFFGCLIGVYLFGYGYKFVYEYSSSGCLRLPDFDLVPFTFILRILPLFLVWQVYYFIITLLSAAILVVLDNIILNYLISSILICIMPFVLMVFIKFASDFCYRKEYFNPLILFKYIDRTLGKVIFLFLELCFAILIPVVIFYFVLNHTQNLASYQDRLVVQLGIFCISSYLIMVLRFVYYAGLLKVVKDC